MVGLPVVHGIFESSSFFPAVDIYCLRSMKMLPYNGCKSVEMSNIVSDVPAVLTWFVILIVFLSHDRWLSMFGRLNKHEPCTSPSSKDIALIKPPFVPDFSVFLYF